MNRVVLKNDIVINNFKGTDEAIKSVFEHWKDTGYAVVNYIYWSNYTLVRKIKEYENALKISDFIFPDGVGMFLYGKSILNIKLHNLNGTDLNPLFLSYSAKQDMPLAFYGAEKESIYSAVQNIKAKNTPIYYYQDGYSSLQWKDVKDNSVLMVGLGSPKQECWVADNLDFIKQKRILVITVGGFFDFQSGKYKRAPFVFRKFGIEWLWRLPNCGIKKNLRNFYLPFYIFKDYNTIRKLNDKNFKL